jgi:hypothetical protein
MFISTLDKTMAELSEARLHIHHKDQNMHGTPHSVFVGCGGTSK